MFMLQMLYNKIKDKNHIFDFDNIKKQKND